MVRFYTSKLALKMYLLFSSLSVVHAHGYNNAQHHHFALFFSAKPNKKKKKSQVKKISHRNFSFATECGGNGACTRNKSGKIIFITARSRRAIKIVLRSVSPILTLQVRVAPARRSIFPPGLVFPAPPEGGGVQFLRQVHSYSIKI